MTATTSPASGAATSPATIPAQGYAAFDPTSPLGPFSFNRRAPGPRDVQIEILYCGVCHSDLHTVKSEWQGTTYPCIPGHEILGRVVSVGNEVTKFKQGDIAAVGCMVDSCRTCPDCREGLEQYCQNGQTFTYNSKDKILGGVTYGGYSTGITVDQDFVLQRVEQAGSGRRRAAALRRHHHLVTAEALERRPGQEGRRRGARRPGPHGGEAGACARRRGGALHRLAGEDARTGSALAPTRWWCRGSPEEVAKHAGQPGPHPQHRVGHPRHQPLPQPAQARRHDGHAGRAGASAPVAERRAR